MCEKHPETTQKVPSAQPYETLWGNPLSTPVSSPKVTSLWKRMQGPRRKCRRSNSVTQDSSRGIHVPTDLPFHLVLSKCLNTLAGSMQKVPPAPLGGKTLW